MHDLEQIPPIMTYLKPFKNINNKVKHPKDAMSNHLQPLPMVTFRTKCKWKVVPRMHLTLPMVTVKQPKYLTLCMVTKLARICLSKPLHHRLTQVKFMSNSRMLPPLSIMIYLHLNRMTLCQ